MLHHIRKAKKICTSQKGNANVLTAGGVACLALDAAYVIFADEAKVSIAAILAVAGIAGIAMGTMGFPANSKHRPSRPAPISRQTASGMSATHAVPKTAPVAPKTAAYTTGEIDEVMNVLTRLNAVYKYL